MAQQSLAVLAFARKGSMLSKGGLSQTVSWDQSCFSASSSFDQNLGSFALSRSAAASTVKPKTLCSSSQNSCSVDQLLLSGRVLFSRCHLRRFWAIWHASPERSIP